MEQLLENEKYDVTNKCPKCGLRYNVRVIGALVEQSKPICNQCNVKTETESITPVRQILYG